MDLDKNCILCFRDLKKGGMCNSCKVIIRRKREIEIIYEERLLLCKLRKEKVLMERWEKIVEEGRGDYGGRSPPTHTPLWGV